MLVHKRPICLEACYRTGYRRQVNSHFGISRTGCRCHVPVSSLFGKWGLRRTKIVISVCSSAPCVRVEFLPHRFAKLREDCSRSLPPLRRERRFDLQCSLMDPGSVNREPAHSRIRTSHTACLAFLFRYPLRPYAPSASSEHRDPTSRHPSLCFRVLRSQLAGCYIVPISPGWPSVGHGRMRCKPTRNRSHNPFGAS